MQLLSLRFSGASKDLYIPMNAVLGLYARENGQGLFFDPDEYANVQIEEDALKSNKSDETEITTDAPKKNRAYAF